MVRVLTAAAWVCMVAAACAPAAVGASCTASNPSFAGAADGVRVFYEDGLYGEYVLTRSYVSARAVDVVALLFAGTNSKCITTVAPDNQRSQL